MTVQVYRCDEVGKTGETGVRYLANVIDRKHDCLTSSKSAIVSSELLSRRSQSAEHNSRVELCADFIVWAAACRTILVGGGCALPVQKYRRWRGVVGSVC